MFCPKCGTQLDDDAKFCSTCGESFEAETASSDGGKMPNVLGALNGASSQNKAFIGAGLLLLSMIFSFFHVLKASVSVLGTSITSTGGMYPNRAVLIIMILVYLGAIVMLVLPKFQNTNWEFKNYIAAMVAPVLSFACFFEELFRASSVGNGYAKVSVSPTASGIIFLIITVAAIAYNIKVGIDVKNGK